MVSPKVLIVFAIVQCMGLGLAAQRGDSKSKLFSKRVKSIREVEPSSGFSAKSRSGKKKDHEIKGGFSARYRTKKDKVPLLPDFYARAVEQLAERNQLPSYFSEILEREKKRTEQPDFFANGIFKTQNSEPADHFGRPSKKKAGKQQDSQHFASKPDNKKPSEDDVQHRVRSRNKTYTRFVGERFVLFSRDPNARANKQRRQRSRRQRDPFGRDARETQQAQNPRGEMDLFQGGVLPKMKDLR